VRLNAGLRETSKVSFFFFAFCPAMSITRVLFLFLSVVELLSSSKRCPGARCTIPRWGRRGLPEVTLCLCRPLRNKSRANCRRVGWRPRGPFALNGSPPARVLFFPEQSRRTRFHKPGQFRFSFHLRPHEQAGPLFQPLANRNPHDPSASPMDNSPSFSRSVRIAVRISLIPGVKLSIASG